MYFCKIFVCNIFFIQIVFLLAQLIFTLVTLIPCHFLYTSYNLSFVYICAIYGWCIWRGGSYYIEVFSERYKLKFIHHHDTPEEKEVEDDHNDDFYDALVEALKDHTEGEAASSDEKTN